MTELAAGRVYDVGAGARPWLMAMENIDDGAHVPARSRDALRVAAGTLSACTNGVPFAACTGRSSIPAFGATGDVQRASMSPTVTVVLRDLCLCRR